MKDIIKNIRTARKMPPKILIDCVIRLAKRRVRSYTIQFHPVKLSNKDFLATTGYKTMDKILNRNPPRFLSKEI
jgi:hypothetical protein